MQIVFVAGGAGFIGSHLVASLLDQGYHVVCIDNLISGSKDNIEAYIGHENFSFLEKDIIFEESIKYILSTNKYPKDASYYIFHLASPASPNEKSKRSYISNPIETLQVNSRGTQNLLELANQLNARLVYASTSEVYGDPLISPQTESYWGNVNPNGIRSVYDEAKRFGEAMVMSYVRKFATDARIVRIFNTYGPHMQADDGRVVSNFITQAIANQPITVFGNGDHTRSFCYVSDMVEGLCKMMFTDNLKGEVINLGNPIERTIAEFAVLIKEMTHSSSEISHQPLPADDPKKRRPDITKAKEKLGWEPKIDLELGLMKTILYFKNTNENAST